MIHVIDLDVSLDALHSSCVFLSNVKYHDLSGNLFFKVFFKILQSIYPIYPDSPVQGLNNNKS